jgi:thioredoxin-like negative regulator of GroEL
MYKKMMLTITLFFTLLGCGGVSVAVPQASAYKPEDLKQNYILYDYYTEWCGVCKQLEPHLDKLKTIYKGKVKVNRVNIERYPQLARDKSIRGVPTLILSDGEYDIAKTVGYMSYEDLVAWIHNVDTQQ